MRGFVAGEARCRHAYTTVTPNPVYVKDSKFGPGVVESASLPTKNGSEFNM